MPNEHYLRITDKALIEYPLEDETEYEFVGVITTRGENTVPDEEGGKIVTHKAQFTSHIALIKGDKIIKSKDKKKWSQKMRMVIERQDVAYEGFMAWHMATKLDDLIQEYVTRNI